MQNSLFDNTVSLLATAMKFAVRRHEVIAGNLANVETPNYKAKDMPFEAVLSAAIQRARSRPTAELRFATPRIVLDATGELRTDGNNVNAENEMVKLLKNSGLFSASTELIRYKFSTMKMAMTPER
jgi:flagellar basal-body rod protein FlgB